MNDFDQAARFVAEMDPQGTLDRLLAGSGLRLGWRRWLPTQTTARLRSAERQADSIAECDDLDDKNRRWLVVTEFQSRPDTEKLWTLLEECGIFANRLNWEGRRYAVMPAWAHLTGEPEARSVDMRSPTGRGLLCEPSPWEIGKDAATEELEKVAEGTRSWSLLAWLPLMTGADSDIIVTRWNEVLQAVVPEERRRRDLKSVALNLSELALIQPTWYRGLKEETIMGESHIFNVMRKAAAEMERVSICRERLIELVDLRFPGAMPPEMRRFLEQHESESMLHLWFRTAATASDYAAIDSAIRE